MKRLKDNTITLEAVNKIWCYVWAWFIEFWPLAVLVVCVYLTCWLVNWAARVLAL